MSNPSKAKTPVTAALGYDRGEPQIGPILLNIVGIIGILVVVIVAVDFYYHTYRDQLIEEQQLIPVSQDLIDLRAKEDKDLNSYAVTDKAAGTVRLPVSRAMELVIADAKEGKPKYPVAPYAVKTAEEVAAAAAPAAETGK